jgi:release factor glutamine methyltransferase
LRQVTARLAAAGLAAAAAEARTLVAHAARVHPTQLLLLDTLDWATRAEVERLVVDRLTGRPLQHVTGVAAFRTGVVAVGPGVFIPRPETEVMTGWAIGWLLARSAGSDPAVVVELCAGSGAISRAIAAEAAGARQWAVENAPGAWPYLRRNLAETPVTVVPADMAGALRELDGQVDLVIANPPYIPASAWLTLPPEVRQFDPVEGLISGPDGLDATRVVAAQAARLLRPGGVVASEHDDSQGASAPNVWTAAGFETVIDHTDLAGRPRFVTAARPT